MDLQLKNKSALVTGSTAGIGFAIVSLFAQEGAAVVVNDRSQERVDEAVERIQREQKGARVTGLAADLVLRFRNNVEIMSWLCGLLLAVAWGICKGYVACLDLC